MRSRTRGNAGNATLVLMGAVIAACLVIALVQGLVINEVGIPGVATIKFGERTTQSTNRDGSGGGGSGPTNHGTSGNTNSSGSVVEGSWVGERGAIRVEVTKAENQSGHLRLTVSATNGTGDSITLPVFHNATVNVDGGGTLQGSPQDSSFPDTIASGQTASGVIEFEGVYQPGGDRLTLSFATIFGFDAPSGSLVVDGIAAPPG